MLNAPTPVARPIYPLIAPLLRKLMAGLVVPSTEMPSADVVE